MHAGGLMLDHGRQDFRRCAGCLYHDRDAGAVARCPVHVGRVVAILHHLELPHRCGPPCRSGTNP
jgi:hypothetical protein